MTDTAIVFQFGNEYISAGYGTHVVPVVPAVGAHVSFFSSRDGQGNYVHSEPLKKSCGLVERVDYIAEESGRSSQTRKETLYIVVRLTRCKAPHTKKSS